MYAAVSKLASIAQQAPEANHAEIDTLVKEILTDDEQLITAREASKIPTAPSYATLARWRSKGIGPSFVKNPTNGHVLYRKGDFRPQLPLDRCIED